MSLLTTDGPCVQLRKESHTTLEQSALNTAVWWLSFLLYPHSPLLARLSLALCAEWLTADAAPDTAPATGSTALCLMVPRAWEVLQGEGAGAGRHTVHVQQEVPALH